VREAISRDAAPPRREGFLWRWVAPAAAAVLAGAIALAVATAPGGRSASPAPSPREAAAVPPPAGTLEPAAPVADDDASLTLLAALTEDLEWENVAAAGLAPEAGAVDRALASLSDEERAALHELLEKALSVPGV
jgi:hypothetical protein